MSELMVYITAKDQAEALKLSRALLEERLVACANLFPAIRSLYWWKGEICDEPESVIIAKTREDLGEAVIARVRELHSYETPCVVFLPITAGNPEFLAWINKETKAP